MNLVKRLKTLWYLSSLGKEEVKTSVLKELFKPKEMAEIIHLEDPINKFLEQ